MRQSAHMTAPAAVGVNRVHYILIDTVFAMPRCLTPTLFFNGSLFPLHPVHPCIFLRQNSDAPFDASPLHPLSTFPRNRLTRSHIGLWRRRRVRGCLAITLRRPSLPSPPAQPGNSAAEQERISLTSRSHNYWTLAGELPESSSPASFEAGGQLQLHRFQRFLSQSEVERRTRAWRLELAWHVGAKHLDLQAAIAGGRITETRPNGRSPLRRHCLRGLGAHRGQSAACNPSSDMVYPIAA